MKYLLFPLLLLPILLWGQSVPIIPEPQVYTFLEGELPIDSTFEIELFNEGSSPSQGTNSGSFVKNLLSQKLENEFQIKSTDNAKISIKIGFPRKNRRFYRLCQQKNILPDHLGPEGYFLLIERDQIIIAANQEPGLLYGVQSLIQLFRAYKEKGAIPSVKIEDYPAIAHRAVMDDISRGPLSNLNFLKAQIQRLSELKINSMTYYIEHVVKTPKNGSFAPEDGITIEEWIELSEFAKNYHIELIGSFQSLGHFNNILSFPQYAHLGATEGMLDPGNPEAIQFLTEVYDEMLPAFSSNYFNINGDEAWDLARGKLKPIADSLGAGFLYANHVEPLLNHLIEKGKKPMMWGDMALQYPDVFDHIPKETTILTWEYSSYDDFSDWIDPIKEKGFDFWVCPGIVNSNRLMPEYNETMINLRNFINEGYQKGAKGVMITVWDDGGRHFFAKDWYGVAYGAGQSWKPNRKPMEEFDANFSRCFYGNDQQTVPKAIHLLNELTHIAPTQEMNSAVIEKQVLSEGKNKLVFQKREWENIYNTLMGVSPFGIQPETAMMPVWIPLEPDFNDMSSWMSDLPYWEFTHHQYRILAESHLNLIEIAKHYREASIEQMEDITQA
ncbi:MAG: family 20 glycosylhydrolase, partial [Bacteroidetes bacterium]|nr:family 20 glycosylhydrolase [Bacteroidota bacterium]